jgi:RNA polymerase sigma-70 factor (ECF subfamily)
MGERAVYIGIDVSDEELMVLYQQGEERAFQTLYERYSGKLYGYIKKKIANSEQAQDILQQSFLKLHKSRHSYNPKYPFSAWLFTICRHLEIDYFRKHKVEMVELTKVENTLEGESFDSVDSINAKKDFLATIEKLSPEQREILSLRYNDGLSFDEISKTLGINASAARKRISRVLNILRLKK